MSTIEQHHNPLAAHAVAYVQAVAARSGRQLKPGWRQGLELKIDRALGQVGRFSSPTHGRLWLEEQCDDLLMGMATEGDE
jgi:hypothetical protein